MRTEQTLDRQKGEHDLAARGKHLCVERGKRRTENIINHKMHTAEFNGLIKAEVRNIQQFSFLSNFNFTKKGYTVG